jgi:Tfp pilus assembly protein PilN
MIKVNLLERKAPFKMPVVLGIDFAALNIKAMIFVAILSFTPDWFVYPMWETEFKKITTELQSLRKQYNKLKKELKGNKDIKERLEAFNKQVQKLQKRSVQVDLILQEKRNPGLLMEKLARRVPKDIWFESFLIEEDKNITIKGGGVLYRSIGDFISNANNAGFFSTPLSLAKSETIEEVKGSNYRIQKFTISGKIDKFDPWSQ